MKSEQLEMFPDFKFSTDDASVLNDSFRKCYQSGENVRRGLFGRWALYQKEMEKRVGAQDQQIEEMKAEIEDLKKNIGLSEEKAG